jgi:signal transduction histidine kinase
MQFILDRRHGSGRRGSDCLGDPTMRGLLHDLGHNVSTLHYLIEGISADPLLSDTTRRRVGLIRQQTSRMLNLIESVGRPPPRQPIRLRALASEVVSAYAARHEAAVVIRPGEERMLAADPSALWRLLANVVDNAVRAAGPDGRVEVWVGGGDGDVTTIDVVDDGPGFGAGPPGAASLGFGVVDGLARTCGVRLRVRPNHPKGTLVRLEIPSQSDESGP